MHVFCFVPFSPLDKVRCWGFYCVSFRQTSGDILTHYFVPLWDVVELYVIGNFTRVQRILNHSLQECAFQIRLAKSMTDFQSAVARTMKITVQFWYHSSVFAERVQHGYKCRFCGASECCARDQFLNVAILETTQDHGRATPQLESQVGTTVKQPTSSLSQTHYEWCRWVHYRRADDVSNALFVLPNQSCEKSQLHLLSSCQKKLDLLRS